MIKPKSYKQWKRQRLIVRKLEYIKDVLETTILFPIYPVYLIGEAIKKAKIRRDNKITGLSVQQRERVKRSLEGIYSSLMISDNVAYLTPSRKQYSYYDLEDVSNFHYVYDESCYGLVLRELHRDKSLVLKRIIYEPYYIMGCDNKIPAWQIKEAK